MHARTCSMDTEGDTGTITTPADASDGDSEFVFDGFKVMFNEKVMLTPVASAGPPGALTQAQSRRWH